jgi:type II secretion system protein G
MLYALEAVMLRKTGFTLIEILVVVVIIGMLMAILFPVVGSARRQAKENMCKEQLHRLSQVLMLYHDEHGSAYPEADNPMGILAEAYPKELPRYFTCPLDLKPENDSYGLLYNYWGYRNDLLPTPIKAEVSGSGMQRSAKVCAQEVYASRIRELGNWAVETKYKPLDRITGRDGMAYLCMEAHTSSLTCEPGSSDPAVNKTQVARYWTDKLLWGKDDPESDFPGLVNHNAPGNTIVTICPNHISHKGQYIFLRVNGAVDFAAPTDKAFWMFSKPATE